MDLFILDIVLHSTTTSMLFAIYICEFSGVLLRSWLQVWSIRGIGTWTFPDVNKYLRFSLLMLRWKIVAAYLQLFRIHSLGLSDFWSKQHYHLTISRCEQVPLFFIFNSARIIVVAYFQFFQIHSLGLCDFWSKQHWHQNTSKCVQVPLFFIFDSARIIVTAYSWLF